jgi:hypothetical protein
MHSLNVASGLAAEDTATTEVSRLFASPGFLRRMTQEFRLSRKAILHLQSTMEAVVFAALTKYAVKHSRNACHHCESCLSKLKSGVGSSRTNLLPDHVNDVLESKGDALDSATKRYFERILGAKLPRVIVHLGAEAAASSRALGANGYTVAEHIVLASPQFVPGTASEDSLLAHELTHVLQQQRFHAGNHVRLARSPFLEREAERVAIAIVASATTRRTAKVRPFEFTPSHIRCQTQNPIIIRCGAICPREVIIDPVNGVPCGLVDCDVLGFFPPIIARSFCVYSCALNRYAAFIINTNFGPIGPIFTGRPAGPPPN